MIVNYPVNIESDAYEIYKFDDYMVDLFEFFKNNEAFYERSLQYVELK